MNGRWLVRLTAPVAAIASLATIAGGSLGSTGVPWTPAACDGGPAEMRLAATATAPPGLAAFRDAPWFTVDPVADDGGHLAGQRLRIGLGALRDRYLELPSEAAAAGPFGRVVLVVSDDGRQSTVRAVDGAAGCAWEVARSEDVIRRATLTPDAAAMVEFRVDRTTRSDLGVWRRPLDGSAPERLLEPIGVDAAFGRTFTTTLDWSAEGDVLAVQSCGAHSCRTRLLDIAGGGVTLLAAPGQGELIGVADGRTVTYAACGALPCPVLGTEAKTGTSTTLIDSAGLVQMVSTARGPRIMAEAASPGHVELRDLDGRVERRFDVDPDLRLMPEVTRAGAGVDAPAGWVLLAPDGRSPEDAVLMDLAHGTIAGLREVLR